jgi:hypothetical protein
MSIVADYADILHEVLPFDTYEEGVELMREYFTNFTHTMLNNTMHWVRCNPEEAGYNIGYVKRGTPGVGETGRFFAINKDDPSFKFSDDQRDHFDNGIATTVTSTDTTVGNLIGMLEAGQVHEVRRVYREAYEDLQYALQGMIRATKRAQRIINEKRANGGGGST